MFSCSFVHTLYICICSYNQGLKISTPLRGANNFAEVCFFLVTPQTEYDWASDRVWLSIWECDWAYISRLKYYITCISRSKYFCGTVTNYYFCYVKPCHDYNKCMLYTVFERRLRLLAGDSWLLPTLRSNFNVFADFLTFVQISFKLYNVWHCMG